MGIQNDHRIFQLQILLALKACLGDARALALNSALEVTGVYESKKYSTDR